MSSMRRFAAFLVVTILLPVQAGSVFAQEPAVLTFDPAVTYQTWESWGGTTAILGCPFEAWIKNPTRENYDTLGVRKDLPAQYMAKTCDELVYDLGLTRFRLEVGPQVEVENDNDDPNVTDLKAFRFLWQDLVVETQLLPLKHRIESAGGRMVFYISYDLRSSLTKPFLLQPEEYAEMAVTFLQHLREKYRLEPDYWSVINEPGNNRPGNPKLCAALTAATGARIARAGFRTRMSGPECVNIAQVPAYMKAMQETPGALDHFAQITYHLYHGGANKVKERNDVRDWAARFKVTAAQTEWMEQKDMNVARHILLCLTEADAVSWERFGLDGFFTTPWNDLLKPETNARQPVKTTTAWHVRQFSRFIRPGAVRVKITSSLAEIQAVAFLSPKSRKPVIVVLNTAEAPREASIVGLPAGTYQVVCTTASEPGKDLPAITVETGKPPVVPLPASAVLTLTADPPDLRPKR